MTPISRDRAQVLLERNVECVCRDGTILRADVYHPQDGGRYPTLLNRTPYGKLEQRYVDDAHTLARADTRWSYRISAAATRPMASTMDVPRPAGDVRCRGRL